MSPRAPSRRATIAGRTRHTHTHTHARACARLHDRYNGSIDCTVQILKNEGVGAMFKGAGANVLRGIAGAGVLSGFDKLQEVSRGRLVCRSIDRSVGRGLKSCVLLQFYIAWRFSS